MRVLVTRPIQDGMQTAARLTALGHQPLLAPLLTVQWRQTPPPALDDVRALVATSANGIRAFAEISTERGLPLFVVGPQSAVAARQAGFGDVRQANGDAAALAEAIPGWIKPGRLLHLAGADSSNLLAGMLEPQGFAVKRHILYDVIAAEHFPASILEDVPEAALFFSPRSGRVFGECAARDELVTTAMIAACISQAAAEALGAQAFREIRIAAAPNQDALLGLLQDGL